MKSSLTSSEIVVGLDLGTTKVTAVVGEVDADGITILGVGNVPCRGLRKGVVSNIEWTVRSIREAVEAAQTMAGVEIKTVYAGVAGSHIKSHVSDGVCAISGREVTRQDLDRVLEGARAIPVDADRMILHALPREYAVDNQDGIRDPIGMSGVRLQVRVNLVTAATSCVQNVIRCVERCNLNVADVVLEPLASSDAVLSEDEKEIGVAVIDIGGGTTDLLLYVDGGIAHTSVLPAGGNNITSDVAAGLRTPMAEAERLKRNYGCALGRMISDDEEIEVPGATLAERHHRAARGRDLQRSTPPHRRNRPARATLLRLRAHGWCGAHGGHDRMCRGNPRYAGAPRVSGGCQRHRTTRARPAIRDRRGPRALRCLATRRRTAAWPPRERRRSSRRSGCSRRSDRPEKWILELVPRRFLSPRRQLQLLSFRHEYPAATRHTF